MALTAVLEFGDNDIRRYSKQYLVADCRFVFDRSYNSFAPEQTARCERMEIVIVAPGKSDLTLFQWFARQEAKDGRLVITLSGDGKQADSENQEIYFEEACCFSLSEIYDIDKSKRRLLKLALVAENIYIDDVTYNCV